MKIASTLGFGMASLLLAASPLAAYSETPKGPDGAALYGEKCATCHGRLDASSARGASAEDIQSAIRENRGGVMGSLSSLKKDEIGAISLALASGPSRRSYRMGPGMMGGSGMMGSYGMMGGYGLGAGMMSGHGMGPGMMNGYGLGPIWRLDLSSDQRRQVNKIGDELRKKHWAIMGRMMDAQTRLRDLDAAEQPDPKKVGAAFGDIAKLRQEMIEAHVEAWNQARALLTKEQRQQLDRRRAVHWDDDGD